MTTRLQYYIKKIFIYDKKISLKKWMEEKLTTDKEKKLTTDKARFEMQVSYYIQKKNYNANLYDFVNENT